MATFAALLTNILYPEHPLIIAPYFNLWQPFQSASQTLLFNLAGSLLLILHLGSPDWEWAFQTSPLLSALPSHGLEPWCQAHLLHAFCWQPGPLTPMPNLKTQSGPSSGLPSYLGEEDKYRHGN